MMNSILDQLEATTDDGLVNVVIDTPSGSATKFKYDQEKGCYTVSRFLPAGAHFPFNFGSIPRTAAADGDALDILVLTPNPLFVGCLVETKLVGILLAEQRESGKVIRNDRLFGAPVTSVNPPLFQHINEVSEVLLRQIAQFFVFYNAAHGRKFTPKGFGGPQEAAEALQKARERYARKLRREGA